MKDILSKVQKSHVGKPLLKVDLTSEQAVSGPFISFITKLGHNRIHFKAFLFL